MTFKEQCLKAYNEWAEQQHPDTVKLVHTCLQTMSVAAQAVNSLPEWAIAPMIKLIDELPGRPAWIAIITEALDIHISIKEIVYPNSYQGIEITETIGEIILAKRKIYRE